MAGSIQQAAGARHLPAESRGRSYNSNPVCFDFGDAEVREAMVPRTEVEALPVSATLEDLLEEIVGEIDDEYDEGLAACAHLPPPCA